MVILDTSYKLIDFNGDFGKIDTGSSLNVKTIWHFDVYAVAETVCYVFLKRKRLDC